MQLNESVRVRPQTFTDFMRARFGALLEPVAAGLNALGVAPNSITLLGLAGNFVGAVLLSRGQMTWGGLVILAMGPVDGIDGTMARLRGEPTKFGGFVDSVTDRWSEIVIFAGLLWYYLGQGDRTAVLLAFAATVGSVMVSYTKARAETAGYHCHGGVLTRMERYLVLAPALVLGWDIVGLWVVALLANFTALQRAVYVQRQARSARGSR